MLSRKHLQDSEVKLFIKKFFRLKNFLYFYLLNLKDNINKTKIC
jgi:hypothetical protein